MSRGVPEDEVCEVCDVYFSVVFSEPEVFGELVEVLSVVAGESLFVDRLPVELEELLAVDLLLSVAGQVS